MTKKARSMEPCGNHKQFNVICADCALLNMAAKELGSKTTQILMTPVEVIE